MASLKRQKYVRDLQEIRALEGKINDLLDFFEYYTNMEVTGINFFKKSDGSSDIQLLVPLEVIFDVVSENDE